MVINLCATFSTEVFAAGTSVTISANTTFNAGGGAQVIDSNITLNGFANLGSATVNIDSGFTNGDVLDCPTAIANGLAASYNATTGVLTISGAGTVAEYESTLRSLTFNSSSNSGTRTIVISVSTSVSQAIYHTPTQHYYEFVSAEGITWAAAKTAAESRSYNGMTGYLATITSAEENAFVAAKCAGAGWLGASDSASEDDWKWVTGPENGTSFWSGNTDGSAVGGRYNNWKSGDEPNDSGGEDYLHIMGSTKPNWAGSYATGDWNDFSGASTPDILGYVVEYGNQTIGDNTFVLANYSGTTTLTIQNKVAPTVSTGAVTNNTTGNSATLGGNVTSDGNDAITERGVCYGTSVNPDINGSKVTSAGTTGAFNVNVAGLSQGTTYHYRAYAINNTGISYGNDATFTTPAKPSVSTNAASAIGITSATLNGNVTSDGGLAVSERGFYYHTATNPKVGGTKVIVAGTTGVMSSTPALSPGTRYYYIAYATNALGTTDGIEQSFITLLANPVVTLTPATTSMTVSWPAITNATSYDVYVDGNVVAINTTDTSYTHSGLIPNTSHNYKVVAKNAIAQSVGDVATSKYTLAAIPTITSTETKQNGSVILTIDKANNSAATLYTIEKSQIDDFSGGMTTIQNFAILNGTTVTVPKHSANENLGVLPATTYYFRIIAKNGDGINTLYDTTQTGALTVPEIPAISSITPQFNPDGYGVKQMKIDWNTISGATSYDIFDQDGIFIASVPTGTTTYTHKTNLSSSGGLIPNTLYSYKVVSRNGGTPGVYDDGCSVYSGVSSDQSLATVPDVDEMVALANGNVNLKVDEKDNPNSTQYYVQKATNPDFTGASMGSDWVNPGNDHMITLSELSRGTIYYFRVMAKNGHDDLTAYGNISGSIITIPADILLAPTVSVVSTSQLNISWTAATGATSYDVYYGDGTFFKNVQGTSTSETGLAPNTSRTYYVKARNSSGVSLIQSPTSQVKNTLAAKPELALAPQSSGDIIVTIDPQNNTAATQYYIEYSTNEDFTGALNSAYNVSKTRTISGLIKGTTYYFRVMAKNGADVPSAYSNTKSVMTALDVPVIQTGVASVVGIDHKVTLEWDAIVGATGYKVYRDGTLLGTTSGTSYTDSGLKANKLYSYTVTAVNSAGESLPSLSRSVRTLAEYPSEILGTDKTVTSFTLNLIQHAIVANSQKYRIILKKTSDDTVVRSLSWSSDLSYELTALEAGVQYDVYVDVRNSDDVARGEKKMLTLYCNRPVDALITNDNDVLYKDSVDGKFEIKLKVWDPDADTVTVTATVAGLTRSVTLVAPTTTPAQDNVTLSWDIYSIPEGTYSNMQVSVTDGNDSTITRNYTKTLTVDKTAPTINLIGQPVITLEVGDNYVDAGVTVNGDDGNGVITTGDVIDTSEEGTYTVTYSATDDAGNTTNVTRTVLVTTSITSASLSLTIPDDGVGKDSVVLGGGISSFGADASLVDHGFVISETSITDINDPGVGKITLGAKNNTGNFIEAVAGLDPETKYYVRTYVEKLDHTVIMSDEKFFTTLEVAATSTSVFFQTDNYKVNENGAGSLTLTLVRSGDTSVAFDVVCTVTGGTANGAAVNGAGIDYTLPSYPMNTVSFANGDITKTIVMTITNDNLYEIDETALFTLSNATNDAKIVFGTMTATIVSEDAKPLPSGNKQITAFTLAGIVGNVQDVDANNGTINLTVPYGTDLSNLTPDLLTVSAEAEVTPSAVTARDFSAPIAYTVIAENGTLKRYVVTVTVTPQSSVNTLDDLALKDAQNNPLPITPSFSTDTTEYEANVAADVETISLAVTKTNGTSTTVVKVNGVIDGSPDSMNLVYGTNTITIEVTAENGTKKTYTMTVIRAPQGTDANNNLVSIAITNGTLNPAFAQNTIDYNVNVPNATTTMSVTPTLSNPNASFVIVANGQAVASGADVALNEGANVFAITVRATDGTTKTYAISVSRGLAASGGAGGSGGSGGSNPVGTSDPKSTGEKEITGKIVDSETSKELNKLITTDMNGNKDEKLEPKGPIIQFGEPKSTPSTENGIPPLTTPKPGDYSKKSMTLLPKENPIPENDDPNKYAIGRIDPLTGKITPVPGSIKKNADGSLDIDIFDQGEGYYTLMKNSTVYLKEGQEAHWATEAAEAVTAKYLLEDVLGNDIDLRGEITRAETAAIMIKLMGIDITRYNLNTGFEDVKEDHALVAYLSIAARFGIINGYGDGTFRPDQIVKREEMAVIVYNTITYLRLLDLSSRVNNYKDDASISKWAYAQTYSLTKNKIFEGTPSGNFVPKNDMSIGEVLQMFYNIDQYLVK